MLAGSPHAARSPWHSWVTSAVSTPDCPGFTCKVTMSQPKESPGSYVAVLPTALSVPPIFSTRDCVSNQG